MPRPIKIIGLSIYEGVENLSAVAQNNIRKAFVHFAKESDNTFEMFTSGDIGLKIGRMTIYHDAVYSHGKTRQFKARFCYQVL